MSQLRRVLERRCASAHLLLPQEADTQRSMLSALMLTADPAEVGTAHSGLYESCIELNSAPC